MAKGKKRAAPEATVECLLAQIPRAQLEELALRMYEPASAAGIVSRDDLLTYAERGRPRPAPAVEVGEDRSGTGLFDGVNGESLESILASLSLAERLAAVVCVCKSWRRLRSSRGLWATLCFNGVHQLARDAHEPRPLPARGSMRLLGPGLRKLVGWVEHKDCVETLAVSTGGGMQTLLLAGEIAKALSGLPRLRTLALDGKQINAEIMKQRPPCLAQLRTLVVGNNTNGSAAQFGKFLGAAPRLETLHACDKLANYTSLSVARNAWRQARGGGDPVLTHLTLTGYESQDYSLVSVAGGWFPNLETLTFNGNSYGTWSGVPDLQTFPRLRVLRIKKLAGYRTARTTAELGEVIRKLLKACPVLQKLQVFHGTTLSSNIVLPHPCVGDALMKLPDSLRELDLADVQIEPNNLDDHKLTTLRLYNCRSRGIGGYRPVPCLAADFEEKFPGLAVIVNANSDPVNYPVSNQGV